MTATRRRKHIDPGRHDRSQDVKRLNSLKPDHPFLMPVNHSVRPACSSFLLLVSRTARNLKSSGSIFDFWAALNPSILPILPSRGLLPGLDFRSIIHHRHHHHHHHPQQSPISNMRIATLQFAPRLGDVEGNIRRADELLKLTPPSSSTSISNGDDIRSSGPGIEELRPDILVLPEMAFSGKVINLGS